MFKLVRDRERRTRNLGVLRCVKDENGKVLPKDVEINERWQRYFFALLNGEVTEDFRTREPKSSERHLDPRLCEPISTDEIKAAPKKMTNGKVEELDQIPMEVWKYLGEEGLEWLIELFDVIFRTVTVNGDLVQSSYYTRTKVIFRIVIIIGV